MAKRLGIQTDDVDLESRLQRIEAELLTKALANIEASETAKNVSNTSTSITGLRLDTNIPGTIIVRWNSFPRRNLRNYDVYVSNNLAFVHDDSKNEFAKIYKVIEPQFEFPEVFDIEQTWYVKVRAVDSSGVRYNWSLPLSTESGKTIQVNEETEVYSLSDPNPIGGLFVGPSSFFSQIQTVTGHPDNQGVKGYFGNTNLVWKGGVILPFVILEFDFASNFYTNTPGSTPCGMNIDFLRVHNISDFEDNGPLLDQNYKVMNSFKLTFPSNIGWATDSFGVPNIFKVLSRQVITGFTIPDDIATVASFIKPGSLIGYRVSIELTPSTETVASVYFRPSKISLNLLEVRV